MAITKTTTATSRKREGKLEPYLEDKRNELLWALEAQGYTRAQIGRMFNENRVTVHRIMTAKPKGWVTKWVKQY